MKSPNNTEIERKFIVKYLPETHGEGMVIKQGYLSEGEITTRIRIGSGRAWITVKGKTVGLTRPEFEYEIPLADAEHMLNIFCPLKIEKTRYFINWHGHIWEVDIFEGCNKGLMLAELELTSEEEAFEIPDWIGEEVSHDPRYRNSCLTKTPWPFE